MDAGAKRGRFVLAPQRSGAATLSSSLHRTPPPREPGSKNPRPRFFKKSVVFLVRSSTAPAERPEGGVRRGELDKVATTPQRGCFQHRPSCQQGTLSQQARKAEAVCVPSSSGRSAAWEMQAWRKQGAVRSRVCTFALALASATGVRAMATPAPARTGLAVGQVIHLFRPSIYPH